MFHKSVNSKNYFGLKQCAEKLLFKKINSMKKTMLFLILTGITMLVYSQDDVAAAKGKFYGGVAFYYFAAELDMSGYSTSNTIDGENFGWRNWSDDEVSGFNNYVLTAQSLMAPSLLFGMKIIDKPESRWSLSGEAMLGYLLFKHDEEDRNTGVTLLEVKNDGRINVSGSIAFDLKYNFGKWYLAVNPAFAAGVSHSEHVSYNYLPEGCYDTKYHIQSKFYYPKGNLTGGYSFGNLSVYAGAGFGAYYNKQNLKITKSTVYQTFGDEIKVDFKGESNIYAVAGFDWLIAEKLLWKAKAEIGIGFHGQTSFAILF